MFNLYNEQLIVFDFFYLRILAQLFSTEVLMYLV
jgi:hypothetical protein